MVKSKEGTERIAQFIADTVWPDVPSDVLAAARHGVLDWLGVAIAGAREPIVPILCAYATELGARPEASAICRGFMTSAELAALINGSMGHALDFDDTFANRVRYNMHPTTCVLPAALAVAEKLRLSGSALLLSYLIGLETTYRVGAAIGQTIPSIGWYPTPLLGTLGAAAACGSALRLNEIQARSALAIAASLAAGMKKNVETMTKTMHAGNAARNGVLAATLAKAGLTGNPSVLDGEIGFCEVYSGGRVRGMMNMEEDLGREWRIVSAGLGFKPYPCCRATHPSIDAILYLRQKYGFRPDDVASITSRLNPLVLGMTTAHRPKTGYEAKFSMEYCIARALMDGEVSLPYFTDEKVREQSWQVLLPRIQFEHPENWGHGAVDLLTEVVVRLNSGEVHCHRVADPKGEPENPMTEDELLLKFRQLSRTRFEEKDVDRLIDMIQHIDGRADLSEFFGILRRSQG